MKTLLIALVMAGGLGADVERSSAGAAPVVAEPEFGGVFFRLDNGQLTSLERERSGLGMKVGLGGAKFKLEIPGNRSDVRFQSSDSLEFVVRGGFGVRSIDPDTVYHLRKLDRKRHSRESVSVASHISPKAFIPVVGIALSSVTSHTVGGLPLSFARYGKDSVRISVGALPPGEYVLVSGFLGLLAPDQGLYCFGID